MTAQCQSKRVWIFIIMFYDYYYHFYYDTFFILRHYVRGNCFNWRLSELFSKVPFNAICDLVA